MGLREDAESELARFVRARLPVTLTWRPFPVQLNLCLSWPLPFCMQRTSICEIVCALVPDGVLYLMLQRFERGSVDWTSLIVYHATWQGARLVSTVR
jgi:hypothetical protein